jgi:hypothetical protein
MRIAGARAGVSSPPSPVLLLTSNPGPTGSANGLLPTLREAGASRHLPRAVASVVTLVWCADRLRLSILRRCLPAIRPSFGHLCALSRLDRTDQTIGDSSKGCPRPRGCQRRPRFDRSKRERFAVQQPERRHGDQRGRRAFIGRRAGMLRIAKSLDLVLGRASGLSGQSLCRAGRSRARHRPRVSGAIQTAHN